jgi:hypothetical protein
MLTCTSRVPQSPAAVSLADALLVPITLPYACCQLTALWKWSQSVVERIFHAARAA